ncbi:hypothetical protein Vadar_008234 [Vaccinium darrowii]|uniref:Uncharacterized protein n=1 Tax=Vaccinium darrowii TaxID=229202 RepID=A0ACB7XPZ9_9ERIC|nr:hypothetical protein Vadar_008234 [Vaccinium darrowii]
MGIKRGPWTNEEDQILISYIQKNGHSNWRALPKHADQTGLPNNIFTTADDNQVDESDIVPQIDESYWSEELLAENCISNDEFGFQYQLSHEETTANTSTTTTTATTDNGMDFWYNLLVRAASLPELPEF